MHGSASDSLGQADNGSDTDSEASMEKDIWGLPGPFAFVHFVLYNSLVAAARNALGQTRARKL